MRRSLGAIQILISALIVTGCATVTGYPTRSVDVKSELDALSYYTNAEVIKIYNSPDDSGRGGKTKKDFRNEVVNGRLAAIDIQYNCYQKRLYEEGIGTSILADWVVLGLGGATAVTGSAAVKAALGAAITGVTGAKVSLDKNAYFDKTLPALIAKMQAARKEVLVRIRMGLSQGDGDYPLTQALVDLEDYYNAGTIPGAIAGITASAAADAQQADNDLKVVLDIARGSGFLKNRIRVDIIMKKIASLTDGEAITLNQTPPTTDKDSEKVVQKADTKGQRFMNGDAARRALVTRASYDDRSEENLSAWEKALTLP
jgi:hypothetical protein